MSAVVRKQVQCTMEVEASTLGDAARVILTLGRGMGDAPLEMWGAPLECHEAAVAAEQEE
jgi:hypothetical protein